MALNYTKSQHKQRNPTKTVEDVKILRFLHVRYQNYGKTSQHIKTLKKNKNLMNLKKLLEFRRILSQS